MSENRYELNKNLAQMLKGGVIMDVTTPEQAKIAEAAGACAVMALERIPADIRAAGGVSPHRGEKRVCSGFLGKPLPKPKSVLTRPAAARFAPEGRRSAHLRAPRSRRGPTDRRPEERSAPGPAQKPQPPPARGQMRKRKGQEQPPVLFCAYTPIRAGLPRPTYSVSARDGHQRPER